MLGRSSKWFNRASVDSRESLFEAEVNTQLHFLEEFEKHCKDLEKALKRFSEATTGTNHKKSTYKNYLNFKKQRKREIKD